MNKSANQAPSTKLEPERIERSGALVIAGFKEHYESDGPAKIPAQWARFAPRIGHIPGQKGDTTFGVCIGGDDNLSFDYLAGVEVAATVGLEKNLSVIKLPPGKYAVFFHRDHVATLHATCERIWADWAPRADVAPAPFFERYDERFDPRTGNGGVEIWIPLNN